MVFTDGEGVPLAVDVEAAKRAEVDLVGPLIDSAAPGEVPPRLVYDRVADSDSLRERLAQRGIELVCPHRRGRVCKATQDGRKRRRYRRRWNGERTIAWLHAFKRLVPCNEFYAHLDHAFGTLACLMTCLRCL